jgi:prolyl-tRNA synthetase
MRYSQLFPKTLREAPKDAATINHKYLVQGGFVDQLMAGSWTMLPLGWRVVSKITQIIREEMDALGGQEMQMPLMHPKEVWNETGRWDSASDVMYQLKDNREREFALSFTHEEIVMDVVRKHLTSYKELPLALYQFSTKFRQELRATSGVLRGREFVMKDMYSVHESEADLQRFYEAVKPAYLAAFKRMGLEARITQASGGVFTDNFTHEFQVATPVGEDVIYYCDNCEYTVNKEVFSGNEGETCSECRQGQIKSTQSVEVGNIFPFGSAKYAEKMGVTFTDRDGNKKLVHFGSYGIGIARAMGVIVEIHHDDRGIIWPESVAPFQVHLIGLKDAAEIYNKLKASGIDVLYDDTGRAAGQMFADADLLGIPVRLVFSEKTGEKIEWKRRNSKDTQLLNIEEIIKKLTLQ